ncbi:MAG: SusC/RagA family TonB-linked outer membrane protein, partial [Sphingobacterium sp.]
MAKFYAIGLSAMTLFSVGAVHAQQKVNVTGQIKDSQGTPLSGVTIREKGGTVSTSTNGSGTYSLSVNSNTTLVISYVGYQNQEIVVSGRNIINVTMVGTSAVIDEVIVVGYGKQKKEKLLGSVSTVDAKQIENRPVTNVSTALSGVAAGVQVKQSTGRPGADGATIRVRGVGTLNNSDALVVIDGIPGSMDAVNPNDIESISVLKDASSASIYGPRAGNGVILITTKKGKANQKTQLNYSGILSRTKPMGTPEFVSDYVRHMELMNEGTFNLGKAAKFAESTLDLWRKANADPNGVLAASGLPNYIAYPNTDWTDWIYNSSWIQSHNISATGGSESTNYMLSGRIFDNPGIMKNTGAKKYELRTNISTKIGDRLTIGTNMFASTEDRKKANVDNLYNFLRQSTPGVYPMYDGRFGGAVAAEESTQLNNLMQYLYEPQGMDKVSNFNSTIFANVKIINGLTFETKFNYQTRFREQTGSSIPVDKYSFETNKIVFPKGVAATQVLSQGYENLRTLTFDNVLRYETSIGKHNIGALLGHNEFKTKWYNFSASKRGVIDPTISNIGTANEMNAIDGNEYETSMRSFFGRVNYDFDSKYLVEFSLRRDASSKFGKDLRAGYFPSVGLGWLLSRESFMKGLESYVQNVKLRGSWGKLGNDMNNSDPARENYLPAFAFYGNTGYSFGGSQVGGLELSKFGNRLLAWEESENREVGLEFATFRNKAYVELNYYNKMTSGILVPEQLPLTTGTTGAPIVNSAAMRNSGIELNLTWKDKIGEFSYNIGGNFAYNKNQVTKLKGQLVRGWNDVNGTNVYSTNIGQVSNAVGTNQRNLEGHLFQEYFLRQRYKGDGSYYANGGAVNPNGGPRDGMIRTEADYKWVQDMQAAGYSFSPVNKLGVEQLYYGDFLYADLNGDKVYGNENDQDFTGTSNVPKYIYGINLGFSYKGFDLQMLWSGEGKLQYYWNDEGYSNNIVRDGNGISKRVADDHYFYNPANLSDP